MDGIRYIHAADLHLDTPFQGLSRSAAQGAHLARLLQEATFKAMERLFRLCETDKPDFLVLAGDVYNEENHSVKAQLKLCDGCRRLRDAGVRVFLAHGNHDPLSSRLAAIQWPDNVTIFGPDVESHPVEKNGKIVAVVHGISHAKIKEGRNLARLFRRDQQHDCFQLGVLHCTVEGQSKTDRYAPCALDDLKNAGLDAWALGHVHERATLSTTPLIAYSGNAQGLHVNEPGPRGCLRVAASPQPDGGYACREEFVRLGPVQWTKVQVDLDDVAHLNDVEGRMTRALEAAAEATDPGCEALIARVVLRGRTPLDAALRDAANQEDLAERLTHLQTSTPSVWLKDMVAETSPAIDRAQYLQREDLLGEALRLADRMSQGGETLHAVAAPALKQLYEHGQLRHILTHPDDERMRALLEEAERLCTDLLEAR